MYRIVYFAQTAAGITLVKVLPGATRVSFACIAAALKGPSPIYAPSVRFDLTMQPGKGPLASYYGMDLLQLGGWVPLTPDAKYIQLNHAGTLAGVSATFELPG